MDYRFIWTREIAWALLIAFLTPLFTALAAFDEASLADWRPWAIGIMAASVRALFGAILSALSSKA